MLLVIYERHAGFKQSHGKVWKVFHFCDLSLRSPSHFLHCTKKCRVSPWRTSLSVPALLAMISLIFDLVPMDCRISLKKTVRDGAMSSCSVYPPVNHWLLASVEPISMGPRQLVGGVSANCALQS